MSYEARYLQKLRNMLRICVLRFGPSHLHTLTLVDECKRSAGSLISGESGLWGGRL